jgi:hypothetical protein
MTVSQVVSIEQRSDEEFSGSSQPPLCCGLSEKGDLCWGRSYFKLHQFKSVHGFSSLLGHVNAQPAEICRTDSK